jgi:transposase-like protein
MVKKGRSLTGQSHPHCKFSDATVKEMVELFKQGGISKAEIARRYGCTDVYVSYLINGKARSTATGREKTIVRTRRSRAA